jgi:hypothetical protein
MSGDSEKFLGKLVVGRTAQGELHFVGRCVCYADHPTVGVNRPDGSQVHWAAHLCTIVDMDEKAVEMFWNQIHELPAPPHVTGKEK